MEQALDERSLTLCFFLVVELTRSDLPMACSTPAWPRLGLILGQRCLSWEYTLDPRMTEIPFLAMAQVGFSVPDDERASYKVAIMVSSPPSPPHRAYEKLAML